MFEFIEAEKANYPISWMCRKLKVARASFYRWRNPSGPSPRQRRHQQLADHVKRVFHGAKGRAGRDQIHLMLQSAGISCAPGTVGVIMRELGLQAIRRRAWKKTTITDPAAHTAHIINHLLDDDGNLDFRSEAPGIRLCGDITYLRTGSSWSYLATVIDLFNGEIIGWSLADHMRTSLVTDAMTMARDRGRITGAGAVFHSDRGAQYGSFTFQSWCRTNNVTQSMGDVGNCWQNAVAESFFSHMKTEMFYQRSWPNRLELRTAMLEYIEIWYNRQRPHRRAGGISPAAARAAYQASSHTVAA